MSERMTDEALAAGAKAATQRGWDPAEQATYRSAFYETEAVRARAEEARLLEVAKKQEERIQALEGMLRRVAACRKSVESSNWGGEDILSDIDALLGAVSP